MPNGRAWGTVDWHDAGAGDWQVGACGHGYANGKYMLAPGQNGMGHETGMVLGLETGMWMGKRVHM